jgi:hypothetical protein
VVTCTFFSFRQAASALVIHLAGGGHQRQDGLAAFSPASHDGLEHRAGGTFRIPPPPARSIFARALPGGESHLAASSMRVTLLVVILEPQLLKAFPARAASACESRHQVKAQRYHQGKFLIGDAACSRFQRGFPVWRLAHAAFLAAWSKRKM